MQGEQVLPLSIALVIPAKRLTLLQPQVEYELVQGPKGFQAANLTGPGGACSPAFISWMTLISATSTGRTVEGDPKARLAKPPPYMPFGPLAMRTWGALALSTSGALY
jgi:hypothetical protein